jgi:hypothetical protein
MRYATTAPISGSGTMRKNSQTDLALDLLAIGRVKEHPLLMLANPIM